MSLDRECFNALAREFIGQQITPKTGEAFDLGTYSNTSIPFTHMNILDRKNVIKMIVTPLLANHVKLKNLFNVRVVLLNQSTVDRIILRML